jgi:NADH dehydrogenase FAD-containing subunit
MRYSAYLCVALWLRMLYASPLYNHVEQSAFNISDTPSASGYATKRIAIVGAGTAGISTLKVLQVDLPEHLRQDWEVTLFEQRADVGGIWCVELIICN